MPNRKITIKEIAQMADVSPTAVSFVLNGRKGIGEATKEKILSVIKETDYCPSVASQRLVLRKSFNVAFVYPTDFSPFTDLFYYEVANGLTEELTLNGYNVVFTPVAADDGNAEQNFPQIVKRRDADGVIFLYDVPQALLDRCDELKIPNVLLDWQSVDESRTIVSLDSEQAIYNAVTYLVEKGHKEIAFLGSGRYPNYYLRCFAGYQNALYAAQLPMYPGWIHHTVNDFESAAESVNKLMAAPTKPTAVCCMSDMCAVNAILAAAQNGIKIPDQLSFISIDDILLGQYIHPRLTTISYKKLEIGKIAAQLLMKKMNGDDENAKSVMIKSDIVIERQTVKSLI